MATVGSFDDDFLRNSEGLRALQDMARKSMAPALEAAQRVNTANVAKVMEILQPTIAAVTVDATKVISQIVVPAIDTPKIEFSFKNLGQIKLGDEKANQVASSIDYGSMAQSVAEAAEVTAPDDIAELQPETFTEQELDDLTAALFARRPELAERFYNDADITMLNPGQKKALAWQWALIILFCFALLFSWAKVDGNVDYLMDIAGTVTLATTGYVGVKKTLQAGEDDVADGSGDKKEGA